MTPSAGAAGVARLIPLAAAFAAVVLAAAVPVAPPLELSRDPSSRTTGAFERAAALPLPFLNSAGFNELLTYNESRSRVPGLVLIRPGPTAGRPPGMQSPQCIRMREARRLCLEPRMARMASGRVLIFATPPPSPLAA